MKTIYKYLKNSNTGDVLLSQTFVMNERIKNIPVYYYRNGNQIGENLELSGYVEISEKTYNRLTR